MVGVAALAVGWSMWGDGPGAASGQTLPTVSVTADGAVAEGTAATFTVALSEASATAVTVTYSTAGGTAQGGSDFAAATDATVEVAANATTATISIATTDDNVDEPAETFSVELSAATGANIDASNDSATVSVNDGDAAPTVSFRAVTASVDEGTPPATPIDEDDTGANPVVLTIELSHPSWSAISVTWDAVDGTASTGTACAQNDFVEGTDKTVAISAGVTEVTFEIETVPDDIYEPDEMFTVTLTAATAAQGSSYNPTIGADQTATVTIDNDEDVPTIYLSAATYETTESSNIVISILLSRPHHGPVSAKLNTSHGTADGPDYSPLTNSDVGFSGCSVTATQEIVIISDDASEGSETFTVTISDPVDVVVGSPNSAVVSILDDDPLPEVSVSNGSATEGNDVEFTVSMDRVSSRDVVVTYITADPGAGFQGHVAEAHTDYTAVSPQDPVDARTVTIAAGATSESFTVESLTDSHDEWDETFVVTLDSVSTSAVLAADPSGQGTLTDDDDPPELSIEAVVVDEESGPVLIPVSLSSMSGKDITVLFSTSSATDDTAAASSDYTPASSMSLEIPAGNLWGDISIPILPDTSDENDETFTVTLNSATNAMIDAGNGTAKVTITDNDDPPELRIESVLNVNEDIGDAMLTVSLHDENGDPVVSGKQVQVGYRTTETTGEDRAVAGLDFTAPADGATLTIPPGNESGTFTVAIIDDTLYEIDELFIVQLLNPVNSTLVALPVYVLIFNNDPRPILSVSVAPLNEGDGAADFTFSLDAVSGLDVVIRYQLKDGTAVAMATPPVPSDYSNMSASYEITIPAGESSVTVEVEVFDDTSDEENETFTLKSSDSETAVWDSTSGSATATIADNDGPPELRISDVSVGEKAGPATFTVDLFDVHDAPVVSGKTVSVGYSTSDGTAVAGDDYTAVSGAVLTIAPGELSDSFDIDVLDEIIDEHPETFTVALSARSGGNATVSTDEGSAVGTIEDDDAEPELRINGNAAAVVESGSSMATFTVSLFDVNDAPVVSGKEIAVELSTLELSDTRLENERFSTLDARSAREHKAVSNVDFVAIDGETLTIDPGNANKDFVVEIIADDLDEFDEEFSVMLANAGNGALHSSTQGNVFGTITDDDDEPELVVDVAASTVESSGPVSFTLRLSEFSGRTVVIDYATDNMTDSELETVTGFSGTKASEHGAVAGEDYTHTDGTLEFAPAAGPMTIEVQLSLDELDEYDELFALRFTPTHVTVDGDAYGVIEDDDDLPTLTMGALEFHSHRSGERGRDHILRRVVSR